MQLFLKRGLGRIVVLCGALVAGGGASAPAQTMQPSSMRGHQLLALLSESTHRRLTALLPRLDRATYSQALAELKRDSGAYAEKISRFNRDSSALSTTSPLKYGLAALAYSAAGRTLRNECEAILSSAAQRANSSNPPPGKIAGVGQVPLAPNPSKKAPPAPTTPAPASPPGTASPAPSRSSSGPVKKPAYSPQNGRQPTRQPVAGTRKKPAANHAGKNNRIGSPPKATTLDYVLFGGLFLALATFAGLLANYFTSAKAASRERYSKSPLPPTTAPAPRPAPAQVPPAPRPAPAQVPPAAEPASRPTAAPAEAYREYAAAEAPPEPDRASGLGPAEADHEYRPMDQATGLADDTQLTSGYALPPYQPDQSAGPSGFKIRGEAPAAAVPLPEERFLTARAQERVKLREEFALTVSTTTSALAAGLGRGTAPVTMGAGTLDVDILAPAFEITAGSTRKLAVPATGSSAPVRFALYATEAGTNVIELNAWNGPVHVAALKVSIAVEQLPPPERLVLGTASSDMDTRSPEEGEYTLEVVFEAEKNSYRFQLRSEQETLEPEYSPRLVAEQQKIITAIITKLNGEARNINWFSPLQARIFLRNLGAELYDQLIPANLQAALRKASQRIKRLNILSKSDALPWEILFISDPASGDGAFLAESASVSRWQYGARAPKVLRRSPAYVIIPPGAPEHALDELRWVAALAGKAELVDDLDRLLALTEAGGFSLLHFAAHNVSPQNVMDGFYIPFGNSRFDMTLLSGTQGASYATNNALVFMNACTSAGAAPMATEMAGWADRFLKRGAAAFVGSLWEVRDESAAEFAEAFYAALMAGQPIGEAMKAGRETISNDDPTRLAYTLFGNPLATMPVNKLFTP